MGLCGSKNSKNNVIAPVKTIPMVIKQNSPNESRIRDQKPPITQDAAKPQRRQYIKGDLIAAGSYGQVYSGFDVNTGQMLAIKTIKLSGDGSKVRDEVMSLKQEIKLLKSLKHKNIVQYRYTEIHEDMTAVDIVLEYVSGGSLRQLLNKVGSLDESIVRVYTRQILEGIKYLHDNSIVHRDIKCANILIETDGTIKLTDFGTSKKITQIDNQNITQNRSLKGSPYWMSPELINNRSDSQKVDIWALGGCVIEMLTGHPPYGDEFNDIRVVMINIAKGRKPNFPPNMSQSAIEIMNAMYTIDPIKRPSAQQLLGFKYFNTDKQSLRQL